MPYLIAELEQRDHGRVGFSSRLFLALATGPKGLEVGAEGMITRLGHRLDETEVVAKTEVSFQGFDIRRKIIRFCWTARPDFWRLHRLCPSFQT